MKWLYCWLLGEYRNTLGTHFGTQSAKGQVVARLKARYLLWRDTASGSAPFIKIRYPVELSQTLKEMGRSQWYRKRLDVDPTASDSQILAALDEAKASFDDLCSGLWSSNRGHLTEVQQDRAAMAYLKQKALEPGAGRRIEYRHRAAIEAEATGELRPEVAERVEALLMSAKEAKPNALLLSDAAAMYWPDSARVHKMRQLLDQFVTTVGDRLIDQDINRHLHDWTQNELRTRKPATIARDLGIILSAIRGAAKSRGLPLQIYKPALPKYEAAQRVILSPDELVELMAMPMQPYLRCAFISALTLGAINTEIMEIDPEACGKLDGCLIVRIDGSKTKHRRRSAPVPWLSEWVSMEVQATGLRKKMAGMIKKVNPDASPYSLRHTFAHRHQIAHTPDVVQAQLAGWSSRSRHDYGLGGVHADELLRPLIAIQRRVWDWLLSPDPTDNVVNLRGKA